ncbi:hypothetical protein, partial [Klebsiella pneumoniae]|uniref:hypothetical protein n=1 Tax=Klebsiella pneumoniae TaxID=573 RepID=UPI001F4A8205
IFASISFCRCSRYCLSTVITIPTLSSFTLYIRRSFSLQNAAPLHSSHVLSHRFHGSNFFAFSGVIPTPCFSQKKKKKIKKKKQKRKRKKKKKNKKKKNKNKKKK